MLASTSHQRALDPLTKKRGNYKTHREERRACSVQLQPRPLSDAQFDVPPPLLHLLTSYEAPFIPLGPGIVRNPRVCYSQPTSWKQYVSLQILHELTPY